MQSDNKNKENKVVPANENIENEEIEMSLLLEALHLKYGYDFRFVRLIG